VTIAAVAAEMGATQLSSVGRRPRNPWIAAGLTLFVGTTGLVYCGHLRRAVLWEIGEFFLLIAMGCLLLYLPNGRVAWIATALLTLSINLGLIADTIRIARRRERANKWYQRWWFYLGYPIVTGLVTLGVVQLSRTYWEEAFHIPTGSMSPTILKGDRILVDKLRYRTTPIDRGDIIVFKANDWQANTVPNSAPAVRLCYVKRVVGLPGDVIEIRDEKLFRNGAAVDEPYAAFVPVSGKVDPRLTDMSPFRVGENELFVVGDNRRESLDSRFFGCIPRADVVGKVAIVYWSREAPIEAHASVFPLERQPEPSRRIRWERFGLRVK
jgi:signal peptidase I